MLAFRISRTPIFVRFSLRFPHPLKFYLKFEFSLQVFVHLDFLSVSEVSEYPDVVLVDSQRDPDVWFGSAEVEMRVAKKFNYQSLFRKTEILLDVGFVVQPISEGLDTAAQILVYLRRKTDRELFCRDSKSKIVVKLRLDVLPEVE